LCRLGKGGDLADRDFKCLDHAEPYHILWLGAP
jgi:hypothetical protein